MRHDTGVTATRSAPRLRASAVAFAICALALAACGGGGGDADPQVLEAGQVDIKLPPGFKVVNGKAVAPASETSPAPSGEGTAASTPGQQSTGSTIPLEDNQDPTTALFTSFGKFRACLDDLGVEFVGAPDPANPEAPSNDPNYLKNLGTCAARSNIQQALADATKAQENLTPEQIEEQNKGYLKWRECMIDRDWKIPKPKPDADGKLFSFGGGGGQPQLTPPAGEDIFTSEDIEQCAAKAQRALA